MHSPIKTSNYFHNQNGGLDLILHPNLDTSELIKHLSPHRTMEYRAKLIEPITAEAYGVRHRAGHVSMTQVGRSASLAN